MSKRGSDIFSIVMKYPYFLTENLSSDDMFVVYAALKKGKDCFFISRDRMGFCHNKLRGKEKEIFEIWRNTHNCQVTRGGKLIFPVRYEDKFYLQEDVDGHFLHYTGVKDRKIVGWCYSTTRRSSKFSDSDEEGISMRNMTPRDYRHELERVKARIEEMREQHMKERHAKERNKRKKFIY
ncbi:UNVERIFIED_CONTAM: hypothetical protein PYX00_002132 [Menopon gallinae]|uniref:PRORP domain-containing protein n=1 Tax=Menopon gallinae TaxID=328185 RepID=A0AAW2IG20_9NEOP